MSIDYLFTEPAGGAAVLTRDSFERYAEQCRTSQPRPLDPVLWRRCDPERDERRRRINATIEQLARQGRLIRYEVTGHG